MKTSKRLNAQLGSFVRMARKERKWTQKRLAVKARTSQESVSRAENSGCGVLLAERLLAAMGCYLKFHHVSWGSMKDGEFTSFIGYEND